MGVLEFYKWLLDMIPTMIVDAVEEEVVHMNGITIPIGTTKPNPNNL